MAIQRIHTDVAETMKIELVSLTTQTKIDFLFVKVDVSEAKHINMKILTCVLSSRT
jgi:hypothetical protein